MKFLSKYFSESTIEKILYLVFGGLTTVINIAVYWAAASKLHIYYMVANVIAWIFAVIFAFVTNKIFVFKSHKMDINSIIKESSSFIFFRIVSLLLDLATMFFLVQIIKTNDMFAKLVSNVLVVIVNYIASKLVIFKKNDNITVTDNK